ncbi:MAG: hypothetical protein WEB09_00445 [Nitriliruptor sp.]
MPAPTPPPTDSAPSTATDSVVRIAAAEPTTTAPDPGGANSEPLTEPWSEEAPVGDETTPERPAHDRGHVAAALQLPGARDLGLPAGLAGLLLLYLAGHRLLDRGALPMAVADPRGEDGPLVL